jgi:hypothetical protein
VIGSPPATGELPALTVLSGRAFGLEIESTFSIPCIAAGTTGASSRRTRLERARGSEIARLWPSEGASRLWRWPREGDVRQAIDFHPQSGFRISTPGFGLHLLSPDGRLVRSRLEGAEWAWQRLLFGQVLPLAATLQGLPLLHAAAVGVGGEAIALLAASGTGKSSTVAHLIARGASFFTDDALAVELGDGAVYAHPGAGMLNLDPVQLTTMTASQRRLLGRQIARTDELQVAPPLCPRPLPLAALYLVSRDDGPGALSIQQLGQPEPTSLLAASFTPFLKTAEFLARHLDACAALARRVAVFALHVPGGVGAGEVAEAILTHRESRA